MALRGAEAADTKGTSPWLQVPCTRKPSGQRRTMLRSSQRISAFPWSIFTVVDLPASEWPDKEETLALHDYPAGVEKAPLAVGQHPGQENLVGGKEGQGMQIAFPEKILVLTVYSAPGVVMVENRHPVQGGVICYPEKFPNKSRNSPCGRWPREAGDRPPDPDLGPSGPAG